MAERTCDQVREFLFESNAIFASRVEFLHTYVAQGTIYNLSAQLRTRKYITKTRHILSHR
jgi:hypothetical protein